MGYWITMKNGDKSMGRSAVDFAEALALLRAGRLEGYEVVRIVGPDGRETTHDALERFAESVCVEAS